MRTLLLVILLGLSTVANAGTAFLLRCEAGTSVTGMFIYVGTYTYFGQEFQKSFTYFCPSVIEIY